VIDQTAALAIDSGLYSAAAVMGDNQDMFDLQDVDGELKHAEVVCILRRGQVVDIAVHEQLARIKIDDLISRDAAVRTADPQVLGRLLRLHALEEAGVGRSLPLRPGAVVRFQVVEHDAGLSPAVLRRKAALGVDWTAIRSENRTSLFGACLGGGFDKTTCLLYPGIPHRAAL